jgi:hypothetical protein
MTPDLRDFDRLMFGFIKRERGRGPLADWLAFQDVWDLVKFAKAHPESVVRVDA